MKTAIGKWGRGAQASNNIIQLLKFWCHINTGIWRCTEHNLGHLWLDLIDQLQNIIQEIYNVIVFPRHWNLLYFLPIPNYVPIGIGPVCLSVDYVYLGKPSEYLKDDMRFLAEKMNVIWQPLPVASKEEIKLFNEYMMQNPNHNNTA